MPTCRAICLLLLAASCSGDLEPTSATRASTGDPIVLRMQSAWPASVPALAPFQDSFVRWAERVERMSAGALRIEIQPCCVLPAANLHATVSGGVLDGAHTVSGFIVARDRAVGLFGTGYLYGLDAEGFLDWMSQGGGQELHARLVARLGLDVVSIFSAPSEAQPLGWFPEEIVDPGDLTGVRYRTSGLGLELAREVGMDARAVPIVNVLPQLGVEIDAAEVNSPAIDEALGLADTGLHYMLGGIQCEGEALEIVLSGSRYRALPPDLQDVLRVAAKLEAREFAARMAVANAEALARIRLVAPVHETPPSVAVAQRCAWDRMVARGDDLFREIAASQREFAEKRHLAAVSCEPTPARAPGSRPAD